MMISNFKGEIPKLSSRLLPDNYAQSAINCDTETGQLRPGKTLEMSAETDVITPASIYRTSDSRWIVWNADVDIVDAFDSATVPDHIYYTDGTRPKETTLALALPLAATMQSPAGSIRLGVPQHDPLPQIQINAATGLDIREVSYSVVCVTSDGKRSRPSDPTAPITLSETEIAQFDMTDFAIPSGGTDADIVEFYLYRLDAGNAGADFFLVPYLGDSDNPGIPVGTIGTWEDNILDENLLETLPYGSEYWFEPEDDMAGIIAYRDGILAGFSGNTVWMTEPFRAYAWPYSFDCHDKVVGLGISNGTLVVLTEGQTVFLTGFDPAAMEQTYGNFYQPCVSKKSIVSTPYGVLYASPDGLVMARSGQVLTKHLWTKDQWLSETPENFISVFNDDKYYAMLAGGGFWLDVSSLDSVYRYNYETILPSDAVLLPDEEDILPGGGFVNDALDAIVDGETVYVSGLDGVYSLTGTANSYTWESKLYQVKKRSNLTHAQVLSDGNVSLELSVNGTATDAILFTDDTIKRLAKSFKAINYSVTVTGDDTIDIISFGGTPEDVVYG